MKKLSSRVTVSIIGITLLTAMVLVILTYATLTNILEDESQERLLALSNIYTLDIENNLMSTENVVKELSYVVETTFDYAKAKAEYQYMDEYKNRIEDQIKSLAQISSISKSVYIYFRPEIQNRSNDIWYADLDGDGLVTREKEFPLSFYDGNIIDKAWYYVPLRSKEAHWSDLYTGNTEADYDIRYMSYTSPVIIDGEVVAIIGSDYYFRDLITKIKDIPIYNTGYAFVMDENGKLLFHPTVESGKLLQKIEGSKFESLHKNIFSKKSGLLEYVWKNKQEKVMYFKHLRNSMVLGITVSKSEILYDRNILIEKLLIAISIILIISIFVGYIVGSRIVKPIYDVLPEIAAIGDGDYDRKIDSRYMNRGDEISELIDSIEQMRIRQKIFFEKINIQNEELEKNVRLRTEELHITNKHLETSMEQLEEQKSELLTTNKQLENTLNTVRRTQKQLIETEKIASLGYLVSGISHEINTPLGNSITVTSYLEDELKQITLKKDSNSLKKSDFERFMTSLDESIGVLSRNLSKAKYLINNFKELAVEKTLDKKSNYILKDLIEEIVSSFAINNSEKIINVNIICDSSLMLKIDSYKLTQILYHLISNSLIHGFEGRTKGYIKIEAEKKYDYLIIRYLDDGLGIDSNHIDEIFTPFFSTKFGESSSGLGLNVVYNIIKSSYRGTIECESQKNMGTSFTLSLKI